MKTKQLLNAIDAREELLPVDILKNITEEELIDVLKKIFQNSKERIENDDEFRRKYIELVNYVLVRNLYKEKSKQKKNLFDQKLINFLLLSPETA